jgi:tyrosine-protein phosphatase
MQSVGVEGLASPGLPSMLQRRGLKHSISSPQMLSTPGFGPSGGMNFGERNPPRLLGISRLNNSNLGANTFTIDEGDHELPTAGPQMATRIPGASVGGDSFDRPQSGEDAVTASYPDGPILMYEPNVHLYLEPKLEEAMKFDVIINVAREVKNPFKEEPKDINEETESKQTPMTASSDTKTIVPGHDNIIPDTATSLMSFQTAFEFPPPASSESSPTTPKPSPETKLPEYIHIPWDHNTDVKDELWDLCQTIEARVKDGKKVLVHCQQGASRSATLIIAYGMYLNPGLQATEAHALAKAKSPWVNPNMSLLFSLNDFKKVIEEKRKAEKSDNWKTQNKHRPTLSADTHETSPQARARGNSTPSSTTRENALTILEDRKQATSVSDVTIRRLADFDFGFSDSPPAKEQKTEHLHHIELTNTKPIKFHQASDDSWEELLSPRVVEMTGNPLPMPFSRSFSSQSAGEPESPALFSPRPFEYPRSSFFATLQNPLPTEEDPRSPPIKMEAPITRSIDGVL